MKVGIYIRVSSLSQEDNSSLENQTTLGIEFCKRSNYEYEVFKDVESGGKLDRKEFSKLVDLCKNKKIDGIWVYDNDRLSRDYDVGGEIRKIITNYRLKLFIGWDEVLLEESGDRFNYNIRSVMSDYERMRIVDRMDSGKKRKYEKGLGIGNVIFGYEKNKDGYVIVNEEESKIVREIYKLFLRKDVKFFKDVESRIINKYGKLVFGRRVNGGLIERILGNRDYLGIKEIKFKDEIYKINIGRIIEDEEMDEVLRKKELMKSVRKGNVVENYLLKGKVYCSDCEGRMWVKRGGKVIRGKIYGYYYCNDNYRKERYDKKFDKNIIENNKWRGDTKIDLKEYERMYGEFKSCESISENRINIENLEELVWLSLFDFLSKSEEVKKEYKIRYEKNLEGKERFEGKLKYYENELKKLDERKYNFLNKWLDGKVNDEEKKLWESKNETVVKGIKIKIKTIKKELDKKKENIKIDDYLELMKNDLKNDFNIKRFEDRKRIIDKYIESVGVKLISIDTKNKDYEIIVKLNLGDNNNREEINEYSVKMNELDDLVYKLKSLNVEGKGFEPSVSLRPTHAFQACSLNHSDTPLNGLQNYDLFRRIEKAVDILFELNQGRFVDVVHVARFIHLDIHPTPLLRT